jgi:hypothetical protein
LASSEIHADPVAEGERLVRAGEAAGVRLRLLGGVAVLVRTAGAVPSSLSRTTPDIDLVTAKGGTAPTTRVLREAGYEPHTSFNALHGSERMIFFDDANDRKLDVLVGSFRMSHEVPIRLDVDPLTIPAAELLLTKLQVVELNEKDVRDALALLCAHPVGGDDAAAINGGRVAELLASDWGLWRTITANLERLPGELEHYELSADQTTTIRERVGELAERIEREPKSRAWRFRARIGDRKRWYELPEEPG